MGKIGLYIKAMRLRTLPLSLAGVMLGLMLAAADYIVRWPVVLFTVLTTLCLQILSNVSNELGDWKSGTDAKDRQGPSYTLTQGLLCEKDFKIMIGTSIVLCAVFGLLLIRTSFGTLFSLESILMAILGVAAISAAMRYTLGSNPYGYRGLGDLYVFLFFGIVSVLGSYFVAAHEIRSWYLVLPAISIGAFSVAVLNVNNIRDMATDAATRSTVPLKIGARNAKIYQTVLIVLGWVAMLVYTSLRILDIWHFLYVLTLPAFILHLVGVWKKDGKALDPMLPLLVLSTFLFSLLAGTGAVLFLF